MGRMRARKREQQRLDEVARGYEAAGDIAMKRFAYIEATAQFERALAESHSAEDEVRLCEKVGQSLFYGARPDFATAWFERALKLCDEAHFSEKHAATARRTSLEILRLLPAQQWLESRTAEALDTSLRARAQAVDEGDILGAQHSDTSITVLLALLGRYDEAKNYASEHLQELGIEETSWVHSNRMICHAILWAMRGRMLPAFAEFERAIDAAKEIPDGYQTTNIWDDYANWAMVLGRVDVARGCRESALLVARERRIAWRIPYLTLRFANTLLITGEYDQARDLVRDALTYDTTTPAIRVLLSITGVELATTLGDEKLLKRTFDSEALELAMKSGEPERIAPIAAAYAKVWIARGERRRAKMLIARGMNAIKQSDHAGDLLVLATRFGSREGAARARDLFAERIRLPHHQVAEAYLALSEAYTKRRSETETRMHAHAAARLFGRLGYRHQQTEASKLLGTPKNVLASDNRKSIFGHLDPTLTTRERQVAELVLRGLTNRAIAETLAISEHTVETHMTSILNRLGLRSRWQLMSSKEA